MTFTFDWHTRHGDNWKRWLAKYIGEPASALEIGCFEGCSVVWTLQNILTHPTSRITVVDTFQGSEEHQEMGVNFSDVLQHFNENIKPWPFQVDVRVGVSSQVLRRMLTDQFDFVYVDGSHLAADVLTDAVLAWPLLKDGGTLIFDDYEWSIYPNPIHTPKLGIDSFLAAYEGHYDLVAKEYQVVVKKKPFAA